MVARRNAVPRDNPVLAHVAPPETSHDQAAQAVLDNPDRAATVINIETMHFTITETSDVVLVSVIVVMMVAYLLRE